jgi:prophage antirepressor-like protein
MTTNVVPTQTYTNGAFGELRTVVVNDEPWFAGIDVACALGYKNTRSAIAKHVDDEDKGVAKCDSLGGAQDTIIINEAGVYSLIFSSKLQSAKAFKRWVTHEVLPSIRKTGFYGEQRYIVLTKPEMRKIAHEAFAEEQEWSRDIEKKRDEFYSIAYHREHPQFYTTLEKLKKAGLYGDDRYMLHEQKLDEHLYVTPFALRAIETGVRIGEKSAEWDGMGYATYKAALKKGLTYTANKNRIIEERIKQQKLLK